MRIRFGSMPIKSHRTQRFVAERIYSDGLNARRTATRTRSRHLCCSSSGGVSTMSLPPPLPDWTYPTLAFGSGAQEHGADWR